MTNTWPKVDGDLRTLVERDVIDGDEVMKNWFADIDADVFLSHSHADEAMAVGVAGFLRQTFGLRPFVDSLVWKNSAELLRQFDDKHCRSNAGNTYDYDRRNYSTSHVHMMLAASLTAAIDSCECIIFLNTPSSIQVADASSAVDTTASPWIYHELNTSRVIRQRPTGRLETLNQAIESRVVASGRPSLPRVTYGAPLAHLAPLGLADLTRWGREWSTGHALDALYRQHAEP
ncbi:hypothetical protein KPL74_08830 [Bacillus sp. NP157]|nr:hypothetical protein KPL74_08830 [Bacillus sp. NP157]